MVLTSYGDAGRERADSGQFDAIPREGLWLLAAPPKRPALATVIGRMDC